MATGRTVSKFFKFQIKDSGGVLRDIPVNSVNGIGLTYEEVDLTAFQDAVKGFLPNQPDFTLTISGPFDNRAAQAASTSGQAAALSGSHTVLAPLNGALTPLSFACYFGIQAYWSTGDPVFGLASSSTNGVLVFDYQVDPSNMTYSAKLRLFPGSAAPAWGTSAIS